jgi:hypothetical protein
MTELNRYDLALILSTLNADLKARRDTIETMGNQGIDPSISLIEQLETVMELTQKVQHVLVEANQKPLTFTNEGEIVDGVAYPNAPKLRVNLPKREELTFSRDDLKKRQAFRMDNDIADLRLSKAGQYHVFTQQPHNNESDHCFLCGRVIRHPVHERGMAAAVVLLLEKATKNPERDKWSA